MKKFIITHDEDFKKIISKLSDKELQNRIKQANKKSNVYQMLTKEAGDRVAKIYSGKTAWTLPIEGDL